MLNNRLYAAAQSVTGRPQGIFRFSAPLPLAAADTVRLFTPLNSGIVGFAFTPDSSTCYVGINSSSSHIEKWQYNGSSWVYRYTLNPSGISTAPRAMAMRADSVRAALFITYGTQVIRLTDSIANTLLATANTTPVILYTETTTGMGLRGITFAPENAALKQVTLPKATDSSVVDTITVTVPAVKALEIYPNPAGSNGVTVKHPVALKGAFVSVVSIQGVTMQQVKVKEGAVQTTVPFAGYPSGSYIIVYYNNGKKVSGKIVK